MKIGLFLASIGCAFLLVGCADTSLQSDEAYRASHGPAPFAPLRTPESVYGY